jgi:hypothetical protein
MGDRRQRNGHFALGCERSLNLFWREKLLRIYDKIALELNMGTTFVDIVEEAKQLSTEEKQELRDLLNNYLVEERRQQILENYEHSKQEEHTFSSDLHKLEEMLND